MCVCTANTLQMHMYSLQARCVWGVWTAVQVMHRSDDFVWVHDLLVGV
jgi:hypothetical protein